MATPVLVRLPEDLVKRFRRAVSPRQRSKFIQRLLEDNLPAEDDRDDPLYQVALAVEADAALTSEMQLWEEATSADGLPSSDEPLGHGGDKRAG